MKGKYYFHMDAKRPKFWLAKKIKIRRRGQHKSCEKLGFVEQVWCPICGGFLEYVHGNGSRFQNFLLYKAS
jgi:hypothetical protein